jgi:hypothetical protein
MATLTHFLVSKIRGNDPILTRLHFSDVIYVAPGTKNPKLIVDKNIFTVNTKSIETTRWRCTSYFKSKCRVTLLTCGNVVKINRQHNHPPVLTNSCVRGSQPQRVQIIREPK